MNLTHAQLGQEYIITGIDTDDEELDGRYNINRDLAEAISI